MELAGDQVTWANQSPRSLFGLLYLSVLLLLPLSLPWRLFVLRLTHFYGRIYPICPDLAFVFQRLVHGPGFPHSFDFPVRQSAIRPCPQEIGLLARQ